MSSFFCVFYFFPTPEATVCVGARAAVCVCSSLCSPQSPVALRAEPLHQRAVCLSAQCQGKYLPFYSKNCLSTCGNKSQPSNWSHTLIPQVHYNVGKNLADRGNSTAAIAYYREAVRYVSSQAVAIQSFTRWVNYGSMCERELSHVNCIFLWLSGYILPTFMPWTTWGISWRRGTSWSRQSSCCLKLFLFSTLPNS